MTRGRSEQVRGPFPYARADVDDCVRQSVIDARVRLAAVSISPAPGLRRPVPIHPVYISHGSVPRGPSVRPTRRAVMAFNPARLCRRRRRRRRQIFSAATAVEPGNDDDDGKAGPD